MNMGFDGVGTKVEVSERLDDHSGVAFDLFAMVCDDAVVRGAEPIAIGTILDVRRLGDDDATKRSIAQLALGYVAAAKAAKVVVVNGETAILGNRVGGYGGFNYNWGAAVLWLAHRSRILSGREIRPGHALVGLAEPGFRSNGLSDVRRIMETTHGPRWHETTVRSLGGATLGELVRIPSTIYSGFISELSGGYDIEKTQLAPISGVAHITGGGIPGKLGRMLEPSGLGAEIDHPLEPPLLMELVQYWGKMDDDLAYRTWHMGQGMIITTPQPDEVVDVASAYGITAQTIGVIRPRPGIRLRNRGARGSTSWLGF